MRRAFVVAFAIPLLATALSAQQQQNEPFNWSGELAAGGRVRIQNLNGNVMVEPSDGNKVVVTGAKLWRRGDPKTVRIEARRTSRGVSVCSIWSANTPCEEGAPDRQTRTQNNNDVLVHLDRKSTRLNSSHV